jgi:Uma2 family endonuclease
MTIADLEAMPDDGNRYEIIEGELFVSRAPGLTHQIVSDNIVLLVRNYLELNPIGVVVSTPGLVLSDYSGVTPDIVFFSNKTREKIVSGERLISAPDLLIEILSAGSENIRRDRVAKRQLYAKHAVPEYWLVDRDQRVVEIYLLRAASLELTATLQNDDELSTAALPGFSCSASQIFKLPQL